MHKLPLKLEKRLEVRISENSFRQLSKSNDLIDFYSNDYLGFAKSSEIFERTLEILKENKIQQNGSTGSRLLSGNHLLFEETENFIAKFHHSDSALIYNSGYDANTGFFSSVPQKGDLIFYDELSHASIREGIKLSNSEGLKFKHNDLADLKSKINRRSKKYSSAEIYIVTESMFSMDGDTAPLLDLVNFSEEMSAFLVVDEAHALGVYGIAGRGLANQLGLENRIYARIMTFGKGLGSQGAAILGSRELRDYLINFSRSFIYTTAASPFMIAAILAAYKQMELQEKTDSAMTRLRKNIDFFLAEIHRNQMENYFIESDSAIQCLVFPGISRVKGLSAQLKTNDFEVKAILSPTVPKGSERLRFCLHSYNTEKEITSIFKILKSALNEV